MSFQELKIEEFLELLASKASVPGGGGASALLGAVGTALGQMVCNLTIGKKKYAAVEPRVLELRAKCEELMLKFERLIDEDAVAFEPLSRAYGLPKDTPEQKLQRSLIMESALDTACSVPMKIMQCACQTIDLLDDLSGKGSALAISDVGVGAIAAMAALEGASLNIYINTDLMSNRARAGEYETKADELLEKYVALADDVFARVRKQIRKAD